MQLVHHGFAQGFWRTGGYRQSYNFTSPAALEGHLKFAHQVFGFFLDLDVAVAQHAKPEMIAQLVAREQPVEMQKQHVFQHQETVFAAWCWQGDEPLDLRGDRQKRLQRHFAFAALQLQGKAVAAVGDKRERMRRVDGQWRQNRKDLVQKHVFQKRQVIFGQVVP